MKTHDLELCEGQQGRLVFTITAPEGTDTTLRGAVFADPKELLPLPMVAEGENALVIPATQAGYHHYEVRAGGATILYGVLRTLPSPLVPPGAAGWDINVDMTQELPHVDVGLLQGPQGPQGEPGASAYEAAVAAGYEGTEEEFNAAMAALPQDAAAAAQSAADAAASQEAAAGSAQAAAASQEAASGSAAAAADSASTASAQAGVATAQAGAAAESAETATTQATAAGNSASAAAGSATTASTKATEAAGSASTAATKATEAANSADSAAQSAADAAESAEQLGDAALQGSNNTFTQTNTFNGAVALNGDVVGPGLDNYVAKTINPFANVTSLSNDWHELKNIDPFIADYTDISLYLPNVTGTAYIFTISHKWSNMQSLKIVLPKASGVRGFYNHSTGAERANVRDIIIIAQKAVMADNFRNIELEGNLFVYMPNDSSSHVFMWNKIKNFYYYSLKRTNLNSFWDGFSESTYGKKAVITTGKVTTMVDAFKERAAMTDLTWTAFDTDNVQLQHPAVYVVSASTAFKNCKKLKDSCFPTVWSSLNNGTEMFKNCSLLSAATANTILDSLPEWTDGASHVITFTGTAAATEWAEAGADLSHIEAAEAKGWTVEGRPATN